MNDADVVVIGSGVGGLTCAALLAKAGRRVLVLERHDVPGGYAHMFRRKKYRWNAAVHYIGECDPGGGMWQVLHELDIRVGEDVKFDRLNPDAFEIYRFGDFQFHVPAGLQNYRQRLIEMFPKQRRGIHKYCDILAHIFEEIHSVPIPTNIPQLLWRLPRFKTVFWYHRKTAIEVIKCLIDDPLLVSIMVGARLNYGENPAQVAFVVHAIVVTSYLAQGGFRIHGGSTTLVDAFVRKIRECGGDVMMGHGVEKILIDQAEVKGVRLENGREIFAKEVVSNADLRKTLLEMVGAEHLPPRLVKKLQSLRPSVSAGCLFGTLQREVEGIDTFGSVYHLFRDRDIFAPISYEPNGVDGRSGWQGLVFSAEPPLSSDVNPTFTLAGVSSYAPFAPWQGARVMKRGPEYEQLKKKMVDEMIDLVSATISPTFRASMGEEYCAASPLTCEHYDSAFQGAVYGPSPIPSQTTANGVFARLPVRNLWLAGANTFGLFGIVGSSFSGFNTAVHMLDGFQQYSCWRR